MNERFRLNCAYILLLSILLHPFASDCYPEFLKDTSSNADDSNYVVEEQQSKLDPSIEQIFRGPNDRKNDPTNSKRTADTDTAKNPAQSGDGDARARLKRESLARRSAGKSLNEATRNEEKRAAPKAGKALSRTGRSSRDLPKLPDKDYEVPVDQDKSEYADAAEDDSVADSRSKDAKYKGGEYRVGDDSERFIDQEERSSLYDDFEAKDVVKRGITGAEDYEEMDDEGVGALEDTASLDDREASDEEGDKRKVRGDVRVKREHDASKDTESVDLAGKLDKDVAGTSSETKVAEASSKREATNDEESKAADGRAGKVVKETSEQIEQQAKRNVPEKIDTDVSKANADRGVDVSKQALASNDRPEMDGNENVKFQSQEGPETIGGDRKVQEVGLSSNEKLAANDAVGDSSSLKGLAKPDVSKIAEVSNPEPSKVEVPANILENAPAEDGVKLDSSKNEAAVGGEQPDAGYEKRVEEQIQRKIDSIKEEIKREIAENQRIREIEENNARFDELRDQEDGDDEDGSATAALASQSLEADLPSEKRDEPSKRSARNTGKGQARFGPEKRLMKRKKRQGENAKEKLADEPESRKKVRRAVNKKRSSTCLKELPKKREFARQVYLVKRDRNTAKKKRKRRSKSAMLIPEQRTVKLDENLPADFALDSSLTGESNAGGKSGVARVGEEGKAMAERDTLSDKRSGSVASLTASEDDMGPLATEYGDAFGGLHGEPGVALARFKRIKRVLRPQASRS